MRNRIIAILVSSGLLFTLLYCVKYFNVNDYLFRKKIANSITINSSAPVFALFSLGSSVPNQKLTNFHHYTIQLHDIHELHMDRNEIIQFPDSVPLMITVETWGKNVFPSHLNNPVDDMLNGRYDRIIREMCVKFIDKRPNVYLRYNPEMEVYVNLFPWQKNGTDYINSFRHFSELCRTFAPQVKIVWGPAGYPGVLEYYPGDDFVDAASITLKSDSELFQDKYPNNYPVDYDLFRKLHRLRFIDKPIFVIGSKQSTNDSITDQLVYSIHEKINQNRKTVYSAENFKRAELLENNPQSKIEIGLHDPQSLLNAESPVTVEHIFADFGNILDGTFQNHFNEVVNRGHDVIATIEPYFSYSVKMADKHVLQNVPEGKYDEEIAHLYSIITSTKQKVYLRYAHEMEIPITRYQWQSQDPVDYIKSFRYFMTFQDSLPDRIKRVWGPAGDRGSEEFWPGNDVVDYISVAIYGLPDKNITDPEKQESFATIFNRKNWRMRFFDKPIFITEFGVKGPEEYQTKWLVEAATVIRNNSRIIGINYFNMTDTPKAWGDIKPPDWSITKKSFYTFIEKLGIE